MFQTFGEKLQEIEKHYNNKQYSIVVVECAKLIEHSIGCFFYNFHRVLNTPEERIKFVRIEKVWGEKYESFLKKPTIGVAIGFYNQLIDEFSETACVKAECKAALNIINSIRNAQVHSGKNEATDNEAAEIIGSAEKYLKITNLYEQPLEDLGFPLKDYLVYTSILSKFETSESDEDFKKIINDSTKLIPDLLNSLLNKVYPLLKIDDKIQLNHSHPKTLESKEAKSIIKIFVEIFDEINLFNLIENGIDLRNCLLAIHQQENTSYTRRETRHFKVCLEIIFNNIHNNKLDHFLNFADNVKKKYLQENRLTETDKIILNDRAKDLHISEIIAKKIEDVVIKTIETELILFQTLHEEKKQTFNSSDSKISINEITVINENISIKKTKKKILLFAFPIIFIAILAIIYFLYPTSEFSSYEQAYFEGRLTDAVSISKEKRTLEDTKAHYYYLNASYLINSNELPDEIKNEYKQLFKDNPKSAEATFYLGLTYNLSPQWRTERDSAWILIEKAQEMGLKNMYVDISKYKLFQNLYLPSNIIESADSILKLYPDNPLALSKVAEAYKKVMYDTLKAIELYKIELLKYPKFQDALINLAKIEMDNKNFEKANLYLTQANDINSESIEITRAFAEFYKLEGKFDKAVEYFLKSINSFAKEDVKFYQSLTHLYLMQDNIELGIKFVNSALEIFPQDRFLLYYNNQLIRRGRWLKEQKEVTKNKKLVEWSENFEESLTKAKSEKKPIIIDFYTSWCYWCRVLEEKTYPDSLVQAKLASFVTIKLNGETEIQTTKKYEVKSYPTLIILSDAGEKISEISGYIQPDEFIKRLNEGLTKYERIVKGKSITKEKFTTVSNFEDAKIIAKTKHIPIMVIVGSDKSEWSKQLTMKTFTDPTFLSEFNDIAYLYIEQSENKSFVADWNINIYPTILFFDENGKILYKHYGFQPADVLANLMKKIKDSFYSKKPFEASINWLYKLEEAKSIATIQKKNIFVYFSWEKATACKWLEKNTFTDTSVINKVSKDYVSLFLEYNKSKELISKYGISFYPAFLILDISGKEIFRDFSYKDPKELKDWLVIDNKMNVISILGADKYKIFNEQENLAKSLSIRLQFESAIRFYQKQIETLPEHAETYMELGNIYLNWRKPGKAIEYYNKAIEQGLEIKKELVSNMLNAHLQISQEAKLISWFDNTIIKAGDNKEAISALYLGYSELYEILQNNEIALEKAKKAIEYGSKMFETHLQLGRIYYFLNNLTEAKIQLNIANELDKQDPRAFFYLGLIAENEGNKKNMDNFFKDANNRSTRAPYNVGNNYEYRNNYNKYPGYLALIEQGKRYGLMLDTGNVRLLYSLSSFLAKENKNLSEALDLINRALKQEPEDVNYLDTKAWILYLQNNYKEADKLMEQIQKFRTKKSIETDILTMYHLAKIKLALGDKKLAEYNFKKILQIPEPSAYELRVLEDVKSNL